MTSRKLIAFLTLLFLALLIWQLRWVLMVFFGAIVLAVTLDVLIQKLQKQLKIPRSFALCLVLFILIISGALIFQLLIPELITQVKELGTLLPALDSKLQLIITSQPLLAEIKESIPNQFNWERLQPYGAKLLGFAGDAANSLIQLLLISVLSILLTLDPKSHRKIIISATPRPFRSEVSTLLDNCRVALGGWLEGMTISATSVFLLTWLGLSILKVPLALLSALVCGILTFLPTIGPTTATLLPLGIALIISPILMLKVLILRIILQNIEAFLLTPFLLSRTVNLLPTVALMAQLSLGALLGLPGLLIALPLTVTLQVCIQDLLIKKVMDKWV
ncbi:AI-2E family transporter [Prochlorococcus sp. MIT 1307]|uniref:AI-2E family transporter n=1 Tax=Prochlorococcus sp. MIT 1307 TaxID=3096219 RepID=UPI002A759A7C|nr:AI-2E family transporter [Prochlorococcus sp. MIT 1307]